MELKLEHRNTASSCSCCSITGTCPEVFNSVNVLLSGAESKFTRSEIIGEMCLRLRGNGRTAEQSWWKLIQSSWMDSIGLLYQLMQWVLYCIRLPVHCYSEADYFRSWCYISLSSGAQIKTLVYLWWSDHPSASHPSFHCGHNELKKTWSWGFQDSFLYHCCETNTDFTSCFLVLL